MSALSWEEIEDRAAGFRKYWESQKCAERQQAQRFVTEFLSVFGMENPLENNGEFEHKCPKEVGDDGYIDYFLPKKLIVEMKSKGKDLRKAFEQVKDYVFHLPADEMPELVLVCDFDKFELYHRTTAEHVSFKLKDIRKYVRHFANIAGYETQRIYDEQLDVNIQAAMKMAKIHDALKEFGYEGHELEVYLVRLLFCMFSEDTGIFPKDAFLNYNDNSKSDGTDLSARLNQLFEVLDMPPEKRARRSMLAADLLQFAYVDGGLFKELLHTPDFNEKMRQTLIDCCKFDWSKISPAIFGSMFQGIMDPEQRREIGAHYTSEENILKVINPLFLDELWAEFEHVKATPKKLEAFHDKIAHLRILDPACGCGNFLITTYKELRRLELEIIKMKYPSRQRLLDVSPLIKVSIDQFYGIEILEFPCEVARTGMWLVEHLMNREVGEWFGLAYADLPLKRSAHIYCENALRRDWQELLKDDKEYTVDLRFDYIIGNPPYVGYGFQKKQNALQTSTQSDDMQHVYVDETGKPYPSSGKIDYVAAWFFKASQLCENSSTKAGFVSTNSITQGDQVAPVWKPLIERFHIHIDFAYRTFKWSNEGIKKAAVHCVIIGFSGSKNINTERTIFDNNQKMSVMKINPYLVEADDIVIERRKTSLCHQIEMETGNRPADGGHLIIEADDYEDFINKEPGSIKYIKRLTGSDEYINSIKRYCLWLVDANPAEIRKLPEVMKRIELCKQDRLKGAPDRQKLAETPMLFRETKNYKKYIIIPRVSSERRQYIPIGFLDDSVIPTDAATIIPNASLYHFGILTSSIHMAWMRAVCGRLKSDYRYSKDIVYNNFPWPDLSGEWGVGSGKKKASETTEEYQKRIEAKICLCSEEILRTRGNYPDSSLADLYDPLTIPPDLLKAHRALDKAVMEIYGYAQDMSEPRIVADLMVRYQKLVEAEKAKESAEKSANPKRSRSPKGNEEYSCS